ncbi:MAG: hypothetical protein DHS20C18_47660 [Saprospiraceae bacterium]|nr:MAG: hypothetical protein DHS20C18_47660 [Saprospiraceae bacterium]
MNPHLERGRVLLMQNRPKDAEKEFQKALADDPQDAIAMALMAECYMESNRYPDALDMAKNAVHEEPEIPFLYYVLAKSQYYNKRIKDARQTIASGLEMDPENADFYMMLANVEFYEDKWEAALQAAQNGLALEPDSVNLINLRAQALVRLNRKEEAAITMDEALRKAPEDSYSHANKGWIAMERGEFDNAVLHFREALKLNPTNNYARSGLKEAIKGKNLLYRYALKYFFWVSKMSENNRWLFIIGLYIVYRVIIWLADQYPAIAPLLYPLIAGYIIFAFSSWIAAPISNLFLQLHPLGKYALTDDERLGANVTGAIGGLALASFVAYFFTGGGLFQALGIVFAVLLIPVGGSFSVDARSKARKYLLLYTLALALSGLFWVFTEEIIGLAILGFGVFAFSWVANYMINQDRKEFYD